MKQFIALTILFTVCKISFAQAFAPIGAKWYYAASGNGTAPTRSEYYLYESTKDTVYEGRLCKEIEITYYTYRNKVYKKPSLFVYQEGNTVYYYNDVFGAFFALYVFKVSKGDTLLVHSPVLPISYYDKLTWRVVIDSVTTFVTGVDSLKQVWTRPLDGWCFLSRRYIEKIGDLGLMLPQPLFAAPERDGPLRCYSESAFAVQFSDVACTFRITNGVDQVDKAFEILLYPNPSVNFIELQTNFATGYTYVIYDNSGRVVKNGNSTSSLNTIWINDLNDGVFSIELISKESRLRKCFVVRK